MSSLIDVPNGVEVLEQLMARTLSNGMLVEVYLVKQPHHYEAALFINGHHKPGPPVPRPLDKPTETAAYWMGVRPKAGLSQAEGDDILAAVNVQNKMNHCFFTDTWGAVES